MLNDILDRHIAEAHAIPHTGGSICKLGWLLAKKCIYTLAKKILYAKLTYCNYLNKNVEHPDLRITKIWVQQK